MSTRTGILIWIMFSGCHTSTTMIDASIDPGSGAPSLVQSVSALRSGDFSQNPVVEVAGYYGAGDGGGGRFVANPTTCTDDGGSMLVDAVGTCFYRATSSYGPREWGARGDGIADDTQALQNWLDHKALPNQPGASSQQERVGDGGTYLVTTTIVCNDNTTMRGNGIEYAGSGAGTYDGNPPFQIVADPTHWAGTTGAPLFRMENYCKISGVTLIAFSSIDTVLIDGFHVLIDSHSAIVGGYDNVTATQSGGGQQTTGFQIKDSQILQAANFNVDYGSVNTRLIGDVIGGAKKANVHFTGSEVTIADGIIEDSAGDGIALEGASLVKIIGNQINHNGTSNSGGYGIRITGGSQDIAITGNEFHKNYVGSMGSPSHVLLDASSSTLGNISFSGDIYAVYRDPQTMHTYPAFAFDVVGTATNFSNLNLYETPAPQATADYTSNARTVFMTLSAHH